jgi:ankyrin repeat protein
MLAGTPEHRAFMRPKFPLAFDLFYSVFEGTIDDVRARLKAGDDPNALSAMGTTPLSHAVRFVGDLPKASVLLAAGARINVWDHCGMHPAHWAAGSSIHGVSCLSWVLDHGGDVNASVQQAAVHQYHPVGWTPLHIAADRDLLPVAAMLIRRGSNVNQAAGDGSTPLHVAARRWRVYKRLIRTLIDAGAETDAADAEGRRPLHILAAGSGRYRKGVIQLLRSRGARLDLPDAAGRRPIDVVAEGFPATAAIRRILRVRKER